jgi:raffinose/stachyose/melibiose transport system permease protein
LQRDLLSIRGEAGLAANLPYFTERSIKSAFRSSSIIGYLFLLPALFFYFGFAIFPFGKAIQYSFYRWDGIGPKHPVGFSNYASVFSDPQLVGSIKNSLYLIIFFTVIPITLGLILASVVNSISSSRFRSAAQLILFLPQIIPLVAAGIAWSWMYAKSGTVNQVLNWVGLHNLTRPWLGDFNTALPAVGIIGSWVLTGLCSVLLSSGMSKIDQSLYEAVRIDGGGWWREFFTITIRGLKQEISILMTITIIAALSSFDIIYIATLGGPGRHTLVPGITIYNLAFTESQIGLASAFGVSLFFIVLIVILPLQIIMKRSDNDEK